MPIVSTLRHKFSLLVKFKNIKIPWLSKFKQHAKDQLKVNDIINQLCVPKLGVLMHLKCLNLDKKFVKKIPEEKSRMIKKQSVLYAVIEMQFSLQL